MSPVLDSWCACEDCYSDKASEKGNTLKQCITVFTLSLDDYLEVTEVILKFDYLLTSFSFQNWLACSLYKFMSNYGQLELLRGSWVWR